jgi:RNA polymerase sigma-70 factor, ECF subfamily
MSDDFRHMEQLVQCAASGDEQSLEAMFSRYRERLTGMVQARLNPQLQGRVDASDVVQEAHLEIARRLEEYLRDPRAPFFLWMRSIVGQKLIDVHRRHLGAEMRTASREVPLPGGDSPSADSGPLAALLAGPETTPSQDALRAERQSQVRAALDSMSPLDREVLTLRHFEQLTNAETAQALGITDSGATARYVRALKHLKDRLSELPSFDPL